MKYFGINHMGNMAIRCFEEMLQENIYPDAITFTCLLTACNHASQLEDAYTYLKAMKGKFGITPISQHYTCILNLISQSGQLYEAERLLEMVGSSSISEEMWAAVLSACKTYGEVELGLRCFEKLVEINPEDSAWYVLMSDLYAHVGRWSDAYRIDELRKQMGAKKKAAVACIEVNKKVHEFVVGEEASDEVVSIMNRMNSSIKMDRGHLPHLDLVLKPLPDGKKEAALCEHAEKMAIAFGLLNTPQGTTLRVSKNLRMCIDCHTTSKIISKVEKREIIIRDSACIHHFKDNMCSCGDMY
jgi:pentatricopeptide repeat protein